MQILQRLAVSLILATLPIMVVKASMVEIYVFGDSLSDTGNVFSLTGDVLPPGPLSPVPGPYFEGRFSNGSIWVDQVADTLGLGVTNMWAPGAVPGPGAINNFAVGGAFTGTAGAPFPVANTNDFNALSVLYPGAIPLPGLQEQVLEFADSTPAPAPDAWYVIWAGANDLIFADGFGIDPDFEPFLDLAVMNIRDAIEDLADNDAQHFLVPNLPDLGATPFALATGLSGVLSDGTDLFNEKLKSMLADTSTALALDITLVDIHTIFDELLADPAAAGFPGTGLSPFGPGIGPCFDQDTPQFFCDLTVQDPNDNIFWDLVHPSSRTHGRITDAVLAAKVPEPTTLLLLGLGLAGFGFTRQRRS